MNKNVDITIRLLSPDDVTPAYLSWMKNPEVIKYLECRWRAHTLDSLRAYVDEMNDSPNNFMFGIYADGDNYIGNIKIGSVNWLHRFCDIGLIVGDVNYWGKGCGTASISLACDYAKNELGLLKATAGVYKGNEGSMKAFLKVGFRQVGILEKNCLCGGKMVDEYLLEKIFM